MVLDYYLVSFIVLGLGQIGTTILVWNTQAKNKTLHDLLVLESELLANNVQAALDQVKTDVVTDVSQAARDAGYAAGVVDEFNRAGAAAEALRIANRVVRL